MLRQIFVYTLISAKEENELHASTSKGPHNLWLHINFSNNTKKKNSHIAILLIVILD